MIFIGVVAFIAAVLIIGADIWLAYKGGYQATLSWHMWVWSTRYPIIPAAFGLIVGILIGHFFWDQTLNHK